MGLYMTKKDLQERFEVVFKRFLTLYRDDRMEHSDIMGSLLFASEMGIIDDDRYFDCILELGDISRLKCVD